MTITCPYCGHVVNRDPSYFFGFTTFNGMITQRCTRCLVSFQVDVEEARCVALNQLGYEGGSESAAKDVTTSSADHPVGSENGNGSS